MGRCPRSWDKLTPRLSAHTSRHAAWRLFGLSYTFNLTGFGFLGWAARRCVGAEMVLTRTNRTVHELCGESSGLLHLNSVAGSAQWRNDYSDTVVPLHALLSCTRLTVRPLEVHAPLCAPTYFNLQKSSVLHLSRLSRLCSSVFRNIIKKTVANGDDNRNGRIIILLLCKFF